jgi:DNA-binding NtrC family response regulator
MSCILVVDDEPIVRGRFAALLRERGHTAIEAASAADARALLGNTRCDIIITDLVMPDGHGFQLIEDCRIHHPSIPVAAMTAKGNPKLDYLAYAVICGAQYAFQKTDGFAAVMKNIEALIAQKKVRALRTGRRRKSMTWPTSMLMREFDAQAASGAPRSPRILKGTTR